MRCRSQAHLAKRCSGVYTTVFIGREIKLILCQIRHELSVTIHEILVEEKTLDGGPYILYQIKKGFNMVLTQ